jgi:hypothetical protein
VQALLNVYTQVHRKDGHVIWVHMDQWEGQQWNRSPGNLVSEVQRVRLDPAAGFNIKLSLTKKLPPVTIPPETEWVKRVKIQSKLLTEFWGPSDVPRRDTAVAEGLRAEAKQSIRRFTFKGISDWARRSALRRKHRHAESAEQRKARLQRGARETRL